MSAGYMGYVYLKNGYRLQVEIADETEFLGTVEEAIVSGKAYVFRGKDGIPHHVVNPSDISFAAWDQYETDVPSSGIALVSTVQH